MTSKREQELEAALKEWQEARKAIFAYKDFLPSPTPEQFALWKRLADAEHALMKFDQ